MLPKRITRAGFCSERQKSMIQLFENTYDSPVFREFSLTAKDGLDLNKLNRDLLAEKIFGGLVVDDNRWLLAVTEKKSKQAMDKFVETVERLAKAQ